MIQREEINGTIFIAQTTYRIYKSEDDLQNDHAWLTCSDKKTWNNYKKQMRKPGWRFRKFKEWLSSENLFRFG